MTSKRFEKKFVPFGFRLAAVVSTRSRFLLLHGVLALAGVAGGCDPGSPPIGRTNSGSSFVVPVGQDEHEHVALFSPEGRKIFELIKSGKTDAAERLIESFEDESRGRSETEVLKASLAILEAMSERGTLRALVEARLPSGLVAGEGPVGALRKQLMLVADLEPKWKRRGGSLVCDVLTRFLINKARQAESIHWLREDRFMPSNPEYRHAPGSRRVPDSTPAFLACGVESDLPSRQLDIQGEIVRQLAERSDRSTSGSPPLDCWLQIARLAEELNPGCLRMWSGVLADAERVFAGHGLFASAWLVREIGTCGPPDQATSWRETLDSFRRGATFVDGPFKAQRCSIAMGLWADSHPDVLKVAHDDVAKILGPILQDIAAKGAWYNALLMSDYLGVDGLVLRPPSLATPGPDGVDPCQRVSEAKSIGNPEQFRSLLATAARQGCAEAHLELARSAEAGPTKAPAVARYHYLQAANLGAAEGIYRAGVYMDAAGWASERDERLGWRLCQHAAEAGSLPAMTALGFRYLHGEGTPKSEPRGFELLVKASELGDMAARYHLSQCFLGGIGTTADPARAFCLAISAATNGLPAAMHLVSRLYRKGTGVEADIPKADEWLVAAAKAGDAKASEEADLAGLYMVQHIRRDAAGNLVLVDSEAGKRRKQQQQEIFRRAREETQAHLRETQQRMAVEQAGQLERQNQLQEQQAYRQRKWNGAMEQQYNRIMPGRQRIVIP